MIGFLKTIFAVKKSEGAFEKVKQMEIEKRKLEKVLHELQDLEAELKKEKNNRV